MFLTLIIFSLVWYEDDIGRKRYSCYRRKKIRDSFSKKKGKKLQREKTPENKETKKENKRNSSLPIINEFYIEIHIINEISKYF